MQTYNQFMTEDARATPAHLSLRQAEAEHRIANSLQFLSATLEVQARNVSDPDARSVLIDAQQRLFAMGSLHRLLQHRGSEDLMRLQDFLTAVVGTFREGWMESTQGAILKLDCPDVRLGAGRTIALTMIASELVCNVMKHAYPVGQCGEVRVIVTPAEGWLTLSVEDDGCGSGQIESGNVAGTGGLHAACWRMS